ncbi:DUF7344 domain-containing protein [Halalkalicoccus jeotgali]|uniref:DUF7344 domain-containing protein n=1 Tax=Halalkalicoccus jeotgali (strain DSM 18796 / CECT 7217 / JCM 14584 / KCTC 4019 / B3) TaxID=795797 RepID=D8J9L8_HALJB|nr:transcriptional regulator [Halalkalicoccus jeotgali]ADJ14430.1 hypothetical protein HacjB3_05195 [Halalkalicoccus jeotgali B3]ELY40146.1 hypothetical protein C497_03580 [Halalkalicoccus jeotgali B3]
MNGVAPKLTTDDALGVIATTARRQILRALTEGDAVPVSDLVRVLSRHEDTPGMAGIGRSLRHIHLPKLDAHNVIEWDREGRTVETGPNYALARELTTLVEYAMEHDDILSGPPPGDDVDDGGEMA